MKRITIIMAVLMAAMLWTGCQDTLEKEDPTSSKEKLSSFVSAKTVALNRLELAQGATAVTTAL